jgi:diguanylate cyclase (GGDEF)-like protein
LALTDLSEEKRLRDELERLATTDPLTDLYNRRYLAESLEKECRRASRYGRPLSCLMIDIDEFKLCNDLYGHLTGDEVLRQVAALIRGSVRDTDVATRYGGEEFCILLPETPYEDATRLAERLRSTIAAQPLPVGEQPVPITVSIGVWGPTTERSWNPILFWGMPMRPSWKRRPPARTGSAAIRRTRLAPPRLRPHRRSHPGP